MSDAQARYEQVHIDVTTAQAELLNAILGTELSVDDVNAILGATTDMSCEIMREAFGRSR